MSVWLSLTLSLMVDRKIVSPEINRVKERNKQRQKAKKTEATRGQKRGQTRKARSLTKTGRVRKAGRR